MAAQIHMIAGWQSVKNKKRLLLDFVAGCEMQRQVIMDIHCCTHWMYLPRPSFDPCRPPYARLKPFWAMFATQSHDVPGRTLHQTVFSMALCPWQHHKKCWINNAHWHCDTWCYIDLMCRDLVFAMPVYTIRFKKYGRHAWCGRMHQKKTCREGIIDWNGARLLVLSYLIFIVFL